MSQSDAAKRFEIFLEFLYFIFDSFIIPLIRSNFYVTESNTHKGRLFFFRHDIWRSITEPTMSNLRLKLLEEVPVKEAQGILQGRPLGYSQIRLLPKRNTVRPIMNLRRRTPFLGQKKQLGDAINKVLAPVQAVLRLEKVCYLSAASLVISCLTSQDRCSEKLGSALFSVGGIWERMRPFKERMGSQIGKLFFAKVDVKAAFDTIPQAAIVGFLNSIPQHSEYLLSTYFEATPNVASTKNNRKPTRRWPIAATRGDDRSTFPQLLDSGWAATKKNAVFVDVFSKFSKVHKTPEMLELVSSHIQQNLVKIGKKYYRQKQGIPQGSVLSSILCNYFYADLETHVLSFLKSEDCLLMRLIDDFLLVTLDQTKATRFVEVMHCGVPKYGVQVNPAKSLVNFAMELNGEPVPRLKDGKSFPYCGTVIDCETLDIARGRDNQEPTHGKIRSNMNLITTTD
jgi:telomerase reverse transcriptase